MRYRNPKFKRSIRDEIKPEAPQKSHEEKGVKENFIATPSKESIRRLWWSKYSQDLKNPQVKSEEPQTKKGSEPPKSS